MIVCLGWGSLIWDPQELMVGPDWNTNGPELSVEFARQSQDGRLTLVIEQSAPSVKVLWSVMATNTLEHAIESLRLREGTARKHIDSWEYTADDPEPISGLSIWARSIGADAVIWTALPPKFSGKNHVVPSLSQAMEYLNSLNEEAMGLAEDYIRKAPPQIRTPYRNAFEVEFGWK